MDQVVAPLEGGHAGAAQKMDCAVIVKPSFQSSASLGATVADKPHLPRHPRQRLPPSPQTARRKTQKSRLADQAGKPKTTGSCGGRLSFRSTTSVEDAA